ncbi:MAG TPA: phospholipase, partial [Cytophagales bacterium]|nr:phospholipase [Cytophagales bacterium]
MKQHLYFLWVPALLLSGCIDGRIEGILHDGNLAGADYWSLEPEILSAGVGFEGIIAPDFDEITRENALACGSSWLDDMGCDPEDPAQFTSMTLPNLINTTYRGELDYSVLRDGAIGFDGLPVVFSWPVISSTAHPEDFQITLNTGEVVFAQFAGMIPNFEYNERNCVVLFGELCNRLPSTDPNTRFPVRMEIVDDGTPLMLVGPGGQVVSAVGLSWETSVSPYDENQGPR